MKATISGKTYDTRKAKQIAMEDSPDGDDYLCRTPDGEFILETGLMYLDGRRLQPHEDAMELAPELRGLLNSLDDQVVVNKGGKGYASSSGSPC